MRIRLRMPIAVLLCICLLCNIVTFAADTSTVDIDEYILAFENLLDERYQATREGDTATVAILNQQLERMGAEELTGAEVEAMVYGTPDASPYFEVPRDGNFLWTSTRMNTHYNGQQCEVMVVYVEERVDVDSYLTQKKYTGTGGEPITYQVSEDAVPAALKLLSLASDTYDQVTGVNTVMDGVVTFLDYLAEKGIDYFSTIPANSFITYTMTSHTFLKLILVKPLTASDDYWEVQLMASKTNTDVIVASQMKYKAQGEELDTLNVHRDYEVVHKAYDYAYPVSEAVKDYCTGVGAKFSYVTEVPIRAGMEGEEEQTIATFYPYTPTGLGGLLLDNYD